MSAVRRRTRLVLAVAGAAISGGDAASSVMLSGSSSLSTSTQGKKLRRSVLQVEESNANGKADKGGLIAGGARGPSAQELQTPKIGDAEEGDEDNVNVRDVHGGSTLISQREQEEEEAAQEPGSSDDEASSAKSFLAKTSLLRQQAGHQVQGQAELSNHSPAADPLLRLLAENPNGVRGLGQQAQQHLQPLPLNPTAMPLTPPAARVTPTQRNQAFDSLEKWVSKEVDPALANGIHLLRSNPDIADPVTRIVDTIQMEMKTRDGATQGGGSEEVVTKEIMSEAVNTELVPAVIDTVTNVEPNLANELERQMQTDPEVQAAVQKDPKLGQDITELVKEMRAPKSKLNKFLNHLVASLQNSPETRSRLLTDLLYAVRACQADFPLKRTRDLMAQVETDADEKPGGLAPKLKNLLMAADGADTPADPELRVKVKQLENAIPDYVKCLFNALKSNKVKDMVGNQMLPGLGGVSSSDPSRDRPTPSPEADRAARDTCEKKKLEDTWFHDWNMWPLPERYVFAWAQPFESGSLKWGPLKSGTLDALKQDIFSHVKLEKVLEWDNVEEFQQAMERDEPATFQTGWRPTNKKFWPLPKGQSYKWKKEKGKVDLQYLARDSYTTLTTRYVDDFCTMKWGVDLGDERILPKEMRPLWANPLGWMRYAAALGYAHGVLQITDMLMSVTQTDHGEPRPPALCSDYPNSYFVEKSSPSGIDDADLWAMKAYVAMECVNYSTSTGHISLFIDELLAMRKAWRTAVPHPEAASAADLMKDANQQCAATYAAAKQQLQASDRIFKQAQGGAQERVEHLRFREAKKWLLAEMYAKGHGEPRMDRLAFPAKKYFEMKQRCMVPAAMAFEAVLDACRNLDPAGLDGCPFLEDGRLPEAASAKNDVTNAMKYLLAQPFQKPGAPAPVVFTGQQLPYFTTERMRQDWTIVHLALSCPEDMQHRGGDGRTRRQLSREMMEAFVMKALVDAMRGEFVTYMLTYCGFHEMRVDMDATHSGNKLPAAEYGLYPMEALADEAALRKDIVDEGKDIHADKFKTFYGFDDSVWNEDHQQVCKKGLGSVTLRAHVGGSMIVAGTKGEAPPENNQTTERDVAQDHLVYGKEDIPTSISFDRSKALFLQYVDPDWHGHTEYSARAYCAARCENINADASAATTTSEETLSHKPYCEAFTMEYNTKDGSGEGGVSCHFCHREEMEAQDPEVEREQSSRINKWSRTFRRMPIAGLDRDQLRRAVLTLAEWLARGKAEAAMIADEHDGQMQITHGEKVLELQVPKLVRLMQNSVAKDIFRPMRDDIAGYFKNKLGPYYVLHLMYLIFGLGSAGRARVQDVRKTSRVKYMSVVEAILTMTQHIYQIDGDDADDNAAGGQGQPQLGESASSGTNYKHVNETHRNVTAHAQKQEHEHDRSGDSRGPQERRSMKGRRLAELPLSQKVMTYGWMQLPQFIRAPDDEAKIVWEVLADHPSVCAIPMCNQGDCLERPIDEVFGKALGGVGTCVARYPNDNDNENSTQSQVRANGNDTSAGGEGQPAKNKNYPVFMFQPLVPHAPENAERGTPDTEEEEEAMKMDAMPRGESKKKNEKNTTEEAAGDEQGASSPSTSRSKMVHPPVATGRCLQNHQVLWEMDDLPKAHTETKQLSPFSCQRRCESNPDCGRWVAWTEWRTSRKHPAWDAVAWLVCKNVMKAGLLQTPSNGGNEEGEEPPADGAETLRIIARNTLQGAVCNEWDKNSPENLSPLAKPGPKRWLDSENGETTTEAGTSNGSGGKSWLASHSLIIFMLFLAIALGAGVAIYLYAEQSRRQAKMKRAARRAKLKKKGFSQPQVARMLEQMTAAEADQAQGKGQAVQVLFQEDKQALEKLLQKDGGGAAGKDVRGLMEVMDAMDHEYTREEYRDAMLRLQFSADYAEEVATQMLNLPAKATDGDEGTLARVARPPAGADAEKFAELECPETVLAYREFLRLKIAEHQLQAEELIEQAGGDAALAADGQLSPVGSAKRGSVAEVDGLLLPLGSLEDDSGIAVNNNPYSALNEDEMNQMIREGTLPAPRSSRMSIPGRTSQAPPGSQLQRLSARLSGSTASTPAGAAGVPRLSLAAAGAAGASTTAAEGATSTAAATTLTPEEEEKAKKLRETRQKNKERDVKKMLKNNITEALADAYGNLINGDDKKARNLPLPLPASDEEMRAVREIMGAEEGEEIAPSVNQFRDALRKGAKK